VTTAVAAQRRRRASLRRPQRRHRRRTIGIILAVIAAIAGGSVGAAFVAYASFRSQLPDAATVAAMEPALDSHVYDSKGNLIGVFSSVNGDRHVHASLDNISRYARLATIDVEDRHFYSEGSWDLPRLIKVGWDNLQHSGQGGGASTITEQLAKISFFTSPQRSLDYKIKQIILGNELDASFAKNQILEMYLNRVPYGNHAIGIETAAQLYFFKPAKDLDLAESAMLAGLPQSPTVYNPLITSGTETVNPLAKSRQRVVLQSMVANGDITQKQATAAADEKLTFHNWTESNPNPYPHFKKYVADWLTNAVGDAYVNPGGWDIYTTLDPVKQKAAEAALKDGISKIAQGHNARDGAVVNIEPKTGKVLALVGAWDYSDPYVGQIDMAAGPFAQRSPGSTIKLFTYTAAIASRQFTMTTPILDAPVHLTPGGGGDYSPQNYDLRWHGVCELKACLGNSLNVPAVKVEAAVGIPYITNLEIAAGLTSLANPDNRPDPLQYSATLGSLRYGVRPIEMAVGAATIANLGVHHDPSPVDHIIDRSSGKKVLQLNPDDNARRVVPENVAYIINQITSNDANRVMDFGAHGPLTLPDRRVSAKTGTAQFFLDNWTVGWTPDLVAAVWVGNPEYSCLTPDGKKQIAAKLASKRPLWKDITVNDPFSPQDLAYYGLPSLPNPCGHLDNSSGITGAAPIWNADMRAALAGVPPSWYTTPPNVVRQGAGEDANFFLPGTQSTSNPCYWYGPPDRTPPPPKSPTAAACVYGGTKAPPAPATPSPSPGAQPTPGPTGTGQPAGNGPPAGQGGGGGNGNG
jgi:penicillin-binding protein 1A